MHRYVRASHLAVSGVDFILTDVWVSMGEPKDVWADWVKLLAPTGQRRPAGGGK
jgi:ornithine carbamoyltransferase